MSYEHGPGHYPQTVAEAKYVVPFARQQSSAARLFEANGADQMSSAMRQHRPDHVIRSGATDMTRNVDRERKLALGERLSMQQEANFYGARNMNRGPMASPRGMSQAREAEEDDVPSGGCWVDEDQVASMRREAVAEAQRDPEARRTATPPHMRPTFFQRWDNMPAEMIAHDASELMAMQDPRWMNASLWYAPNYYAGAREHFWLPDYGRTFYNDLWGAVDPHHAVLDAYFQDRLQREAREERTEPSVRKKQGGRAKTPPRQRSKTPPKKPWSRFW